ncbi:MAG: hypothetical protein Q9228_002084 [Teloschistes exilis]
MRVGATESVFETDEPRRGAVGEKGEGREVMKPSLTPPPPPNIVTCTYSTRYCSLFRYTCSLLASPHVSNEFREAFGWQSMMQDANDSVQSCHPHVTLCKPNIRHDAIVLCRAFAPPPGSDCPGPL